LTFQLPSKKKLTSELYLPFWFCFYAHNNYITLEKAKLLIIKNKIAEEKQKPVNNFKTRKAEINE
jgi:hypothetical protein